MRGASPLRRGPITPRLLVFSALLVGTAASSTLVLGQDAARRDAMLPVGARASILTKGDTAGEPPASANDTLGAWISADPPLPEAWPPSPRRPDGERPMSAAEASGGQTNAANDHGGRPAWSGSSASSLPEPLDMRALALRLCFGTALVLTAFLCLAWVAKWLQRSQRTAGKRVRVVETLVVAPRCWVQLVEVDQRKLLLACDSRGIRTVVPLEANFESTLNAATEEGDPLDDEEGLLAVYRSRMETRHAA